MTKSPRKKSASKKKPSIEEIRAVADPGAWERLVRKLFEPSPADKIIALVEAKLAELRGTAGARDLYNELSYKMKVDYPAYNRLFMRGLDGKTEIERRAENALKDLTRPAGKNGAEEPR
jgi:hypothetical protein